MMKGTWTCFDCRKSYNRPHAKCPCCGNNELKYMGLYFKPPKQSKDKEWEAVEMLIEAGLPYNHDGAGKRPKHPRDTAEFLAREDVQQWIVSYRALAERAKLRRK